MNPRGWTLAELMIVLAVAGGLFMLGAPLIRNVGRGTVKTQQTMDRNREARAAMGVLERDLLSSRSSSVANVLPEGDFESAPFRPARDSPANGESWVFPRVRPRRFPDRFAEASVRARPDVAKTGQRGLLMTVAGVDYTVYTKPFLLFPGDHLLGGWVKSFSRGAARPAAIQLVEASPNGDRAHPNDPPAATLSAFSPEEWTFLARIVNIPTEASYRLELSFEGMTVDPENQATAAFDGIRLLPLALELTPGKGGSLEFDRFDVSGPDEGRAHRVRYHLEGQGPSGILVRETVSPAGPEQTAEFPHIRRVGLAWDFFQGQSGALPTPLPPHLFTKGFDCPLILTIESGESPENAAGGTLEASLRLPEE